MLNETSSRTLPRRVGLALLILAPICFLVAATYAIFLPRMFSASTTFQLLHRDVDGPRVPAAFESAKTQYPSRMQQPLAARFRIESSDASGKFVITATDPQPLHALHTANGLTVLVNDYLRDAANDEFFRAKILEKPEMPNKPSHPNVALIMQIGVYAGIFCAVAGVILRKYPRGAPNPAPPPPAPFDY